jgi:hypothetical protein
LAVMRTELCGILSEKWFTAIQHKMVLKTRANYYSYPGTYNALGIINASRTYLIHFALYREYNSNEYKVSFYRATVLKAKQVTSIDYTAVPGVSGGSVHGLCPLGCGGRITHAVWLDVNRLCNAWRKKSHLVVAWLPCRIIQKGASVTRARAHNARRIARSIRHQRRTSRMLRAVCLLPWLARSMVQSMTKRGPEPSQETSIRERC